MNSDGDRSSTHIIDPHTVEGIDPHAVEGIDPHTVEGIRREYRCDLSTFYGYTNRSRVTYHSRQGHGSRGHDRANLNKPRNKAINLPTQLANNEPAGNRS